VVEAVLASFCFVAISALSARGAARSRTYFATLPWPDLYDDEAIYRRMKKRVFTRSWWVATLAGAIMFFAAWVWRNEVAAACLIIGAVILMSTVTAVVAFRLFREAVAELGLSYPPAPAPPCDGPGPNPC